MTSKPCRYCEGRRFHVYEQVWRGQQTFIKYPCTSCNGTGIDGNPARLLLIWFLAAGVTVAAVLSLLVL